ncbi:hypothetical protein SLE2022_004570 [Rubroshorea leprosula]
MGLRLHLFQGQSGRLTSEILILFLQWINKIEVRLICSYCKKHDEIEVPDPYYGGPQGFEKVVDLLEDACESLLDSILAENSHLNS